MAMLLGTIFAGTAQAAPSNIKKTFSSNAQVAIPDWSPPVDGHVGQTVSPIQVAGIVGNITKVTASFYVTHASTNELDIAIVGPDPAIWAYLFTPLASNGTSFGTSCADADRTTFDDAAAMEIIDGTSPYVGSFRPQADREHPMSTFNGHIVASDGTWYLDVIDTAEGNTGTIECWSLLIETDGGQALRFDNDTPMALQDPVDASGGPGIGSSALTASGLADAVSAVSVSVWITHANVSDLDLILVSPSGEEVRLAQQVGGTGDDFGTSCSKRTTFDDRGKSAISSGAAPFVGTFRPTEALSAFTGSPANGEWRLKVADNAEGVVGQINCWSLNVQSGTAVTETGFRVTPLLSAPQPLPGTYDYAYFSLQNNTANSVTDVTLTSTLPNSLSDVRADPVNLPGCVVVGQVVTCTWADIGPGQTVFGGAIALVGNPKKGKICLNADVTGTGINAITASRCFNTSDYPRGDQGTGYGIGDIAHDLVLVDQDGNPAAMSDYAGKYVLLQFTAVWCGPSNVEVPQDRDEIAVLNHTNAMVVEVVYLSILIDGPTPGTASTQQHALNWANRFDLTSPVLWTANDLTLSADQQHMAYDIVAGEPGAAYPTSVFIRPDGTIFDVRVGVEEPGGTTDRFLADLN